MAAGFELPRLELKEEDVVVELLIDEDGCGG
jgi:hypothetical protein